MANAFKITSFVISGSPRNSSSERRPHLVLVGGGPHQARLEELARERPRLTLLPFVKDRGELARLYASADFYLATGPGETFGLSIAEALACGLPGVAVGGRTRPRT